MAKGQQAKSEVMQAILECFRGKAFIYEKDVRVNWVEDGQPIQIKISLTASKVAVERGGDNAVPGAVVAEPRADRIEFGAATAAPSQPVTAPSAEEKARVAALLASMGL